MPRNVSGVQFSCSSSRDRCSASRSRIRARKSPAIGRSSGASGRSEGRHSPSPRSKACRPWTQPRQLSCAIATVMSAIVAPRPTKKKKRYFRVSSLRRATKLMSCTSTRSPSAVPSTSSGRTETSTGPCALLSRWLSTDEPENRSRLVHATSGGSVGLAIGGSALAGQKAIANRRSSRVMREKSWRIRARFRVRTRSWSGSCTVFAIRVARMSRSRMNHRRVSSSTSGTTAYAIAPTARSSGMMNRRESRIGIPQ